MTNKSDCYYSRNPFVFIIGRGAQRHYKFQMLNEIKKAQGIMEKTLDERQKTNGQH